MQYFHYLICGAQPQAHPLLHESLITNTNVYFKKGLNHFLKYLDNVT